MQTIQTIAGRIVAGFSLLLAAVSAHASGNATISQNTGPNDYRSWSFKGGLDLTEPLRLYIDSLLSTSSVSDTMHQSGVGMSWKASELISANYRYSSTNDSTLLVTGNEGGVTFALDTLWEGDLFTSLDMDYGDFKYQSAVPGNAGRTLTQNRISVGLSQDLTEDFSVYAYHDRYLYDRNVIPLALALIIRSRNTADAAYTLLAFPDITNTLGISWNMTDKLIFNLSGARTLTLTQQELRNRTISFKYRINKTYSLGASASRATSTQLQGPLGNILQAESDDSYTGINAGVSF